MKKRLKLKPYVLPTVYLAIVATLVTTVFLTSQSQKEKLKEKEELTYVSGSILGNDVPVISTETKIIRPFTNEKVSIGKYFYDYQAENTRQEQSIIYHENTYMQNSGMDFVLEEAFEVVSVLDGTVVSVKEDELLGKTVEIRHENDYITVYQSLGEVTVKKDAVIKQGDVIGKSGTNQLDASLKNHLHFEMFHKGQVVNPELYFDKTLNEQ